MAKQPEKLPVGVSQCLLGDPVRYDGGHKHYPFLTGPLSEYFEYRPVCPEVAIGLGVPRKPIHLVATDAGSRVRGIENPELDVSEALSALADLVVTQMPDLCGYIFMQGSPSCGVSPLNRYGENGEFVDSGGQGHYAQRLMALMPRLPVEEAAGLEDPERRERFIARVHSYHKWKKGLETSR